ncbi:MAG TPA: antibiotic biosynthesis monooxygenase [Thermoanaerobaculia bacterium]|nr:antibiotic biosynthesis monooxygenase [Thermoanaerobaculia bacterium]
MKSDREASAGGSLVLLLVSPSRREDFFHVTRLKVVAARLEEGVVAFELFQHKTRRGRYLLREVYKSPKDVELHKATDHYARWCSAMDDLLTEPRRRIEPGDLDWHEWRRVI